MNKKGFTLIELLAVIVILAILMVAAGTAVISTMNNAKINTFKNEALQAIDSAKMMYSDVSLNSNSNKYLAPSGANQYRLMCVTLNGLVENGYLEKDLNGSGYKGVIMVEVPISGGETKYTIWVTNGTYGINGYERSKISALNVKNGIITNMDEKLDTHTGSWFNYSAGIDWAYSLNNKIDAASKGNDDNIDHLTTPSFSVYGGSECSYSNVYCINSKL